jgi:acyl transferase domain-containing protein/NAD(P)H-dependent flavin oxidoreductase YrpB (nitropropane dioxygenase family)/NAD(P)-dependent dehydrogenase (short-subunit alcohol dehydrogenase family)/acyl carrier protein
MGLCPTGEPNPGLVAAVARGGGLGVLDLGHDPAAARQALAETVRRAPGGFAVRVSPGSPLTPADLPDAVCAVLVDAPALDVLPAWAPDAAGRPVLVQVVSSAEARAAVAAGAAGVVARGSEAGGRIGSLTAFVLFQTLMAELPDTPVWVAGGIGPHTAAAVVAGGGAGVVLDGQLALVAEVSLPHRVASAIRAMDGTETVVVDGHRVYTRPDLPIAALAGPGGVTARLGARDLHRQLLPVGAEAALARPLAERYRSAAAVVRAISEAAVNGVTAAAGKSRTAAGRDGRLVVQGPMTRVSDQAAFAAAVAGGGGLPFLALALMDGEQTARLLASTAELLGDTGRPWGVGLLGFSPPEVRSAQLDAVLAVRPPYAIIAGGRPDQAAPLDAAGITTFLHVPSPGLLDRYLAQGARRFVFEGSECGGHVGPRASFPLWQSQVDRLLAFDDDLSDVRVLFAGGIHDERSSAMVAALAAPLAARGADVGVLMGTAYLFTAEAVSAGAIVPRFQQVAVDTAETVLLETSPGHATRCARTGYVETFALARQRLAETGATVQDSWAELERLNLGRLRVASKGLRRQDGELQAVAEGVQQRDGMYMLGDVATLRSATTTIAELHRQVTEGADALLTRRAAAFAPAPAVVREPEPLDIAIVGMACVLPQAEDLATFWHNTVTGLDAVTEIPAGRWDVGRYFDPDAYRRARRDATPSKWGGFLPKVKFDALGYGIPPASLASIEPVQLLALEVAARALADAGYADRPFARDRASVIFGAEAGHDLATAYGFRALLPGYLGDLPPELDAHLPTVTEDSFPGVLSNVIAGRIANRLDLGGVNYTVDAACAASLAALDLACKELRAGSSDLVLCGAADLHNGIYDYLMFASVRALSPSGRCATFDAEADGIALGEGVACVALKRLADAERDGDRVYAVIKAVAGSSDGRSLGLTAPRPQGQRLALERAYATAGLSVADVGMVEAHGTGTVVGDRTELAVLTEVFTEAGAAPGSTALGSVKSQVGHTKCAAGLAGLIKAAFAVHTGVRPPTLHLGAPNPYWDSATSPFGFDRAARPWARPPAERIAGVSAFGFGGTNFHAVVAGYDGGGEPAHGLDEWPAELFLFRGADREAATRQLDRLTALVTANDTAGRPWRLRDLAWTLAAGVDTDLPVQVAIVAHDLDGLAAALAPARDFTADANLGVYVKAGTGPGRVAFLFPGQGSQRPGMLADLFVAFPQLRAAISGPAARYADVMFPPAAFDAATEQAQRAALADTRVAQPALGIADLAAYRLLTSLGVRPDQVAGHSYGEVVALTAAGALDPADLAGLSADRAAAILGAAGDDPGAMAAVAATAAQVREALAAHPDVVLANHNAPAQTVISGPTAAVDAALGALAGLRIGAKRLPVACAFHSPVVAAGAVTFGAALAEREVRAPAVEVWSNTEAAPYPDQPGGIRALLARQIADPVRFAEQIEAMYAAGARTFVEAGPGDVLTRLVRAILGDRPYVTVALDRAGDPGLPRLLRALAELAVTGVAVDPEPLFAGRAAAVVSTSAVPARPGWTIDGHLVRTADGESLPGGLRPAQVVVTAPSPAAPAAERDAAVMEFLRGARELVATQREVMLGYLGATAVAPLAQIPVPEPLAVTSPPVVVPPTPEHRDVLALVVATVSERTGYPPEMLDPGLDLEADLSVDSIKRTELIGELADRLGFGGVGGQIDEAVVEELARIKTIRGIVDWIEGQTGPGQPAPAPAPAVQDVLALVVATVSERTGYPPEMLDPGLDLEADLSVDSIKRTELIGELADRLGFGGVAGQIDEAVVEELARIKTIRGIVDWIETRTGVTANPASRRSAAESRPHSHAGVRQAGSAVPQDGYQGAERRVSDGSRSEDGRTTGALQRFVVGVREIAHLDAVPAGVLAGRRVAVVADGRGVSLELADLLEENGAAVSVYDSAGDVPDTDGLVYLAGLGPEPAPDVPEVFDVLRRAVLGGVRSLIVVTGSAGTFGHGWAGDPATDPTPGAGLRGLIRTIAREYPDLLVRAVDVDPKEAPRKIARHLLDELGSPDGPVVVGYTNGTRNTLRVVGEPAAGSVDVSAACRAAGLGPEAVVLLTGGARGITAAVATALADASGCHLELVGRTPLGFEEPDPQVMAADGEPGLRRLLVERGMRDPAEIGAAARRLAAEREIRQTLDRLAGRAASVRYTALDVRDAAAVSRFVADVRARHGRLDTIVHGAGLCEDKLLADKTPESFDRVFGTKVDGARAIVAAAPPDLAHLVVFGSVSGVFGNRGQADYAAANDALDTLARTWRHGRVARRVLSVDWGPWAPEAGGMVTAELAREYARRGVGMIDPAEGVAALLAELAFGPADRCQAGFLNAPVETFE